MSRRSTPRKQRERNPLEDVLVVSVRKSFWASPECEIFPHRVYSPIVYGHSTNLLNTTLLAFKVLAACLRHRPKLIFFGSAPRAVPLFLGLRLLRLTRVGLIATNQVYFGARGLPYLDRVIVYSRDEVKDPTKHRYLPIPSDGDFASVVPQREQSPYVFSGGGAQRDFPSLIEAVRGLDVRLILVTFSPRELDYEGELPSNCTVLWLMPLERFLSYLAGSLFVVIPLRKGKTPRGHTTTAQALSLGKAVVTTREANVGDYVRDGVEGLLVEAGDVAGYRRAIRRLVEDEELRRSCEENARRRAPEFSYAAFADSIAALCREVLEERARARS
jgi:glycosyltransferase involved in cell wall biosynthesis